MTSLVSPAPLWRNQSNDVEDASLASTIPIPLVDGRVASSVQESYMSSVCIALMRRAKELAESRLKQGEMGRRFLSAVSEHGLGFTENAAGENVTEAKIGGMSSAEDSSSGTDKRQGASSSAHIASDTVSDEACRNATAETESVSPPTTLRQRIIGNIFDDEAVKAHQQQHLAVGQTFSRQRVSAFLTRVRLSLASLSGKECVQKSIEQLSDSAAFFKDQLEEDGHFAPLMTVAVLASVLFAKF